MLVKAIILNLAYLLAFVLQERGFTLYGLWRSENGGCFLLKSYLHKKIRLWWAYGLPGSNGGGMERNYIHIELLHIFHPSTQIQAFHAWRSALITSWWINLGAHVASENKALSSVGSYWAKASSLSSGFNERLPLLSIKMVVASWQCPSAPSRRDPQQQAFWNCYNHNSNCCSNVPTAFTVSSDFVLLSLNCSFPFTTFVFPNDTTRTRKARETNNIHKASLLSETHKLVRSL